VTAINEYRYNNAHSNLADPANDPTSHVFCTARRSKLIGLAMRKVEAGIKRLREYFPRRDNNDEQTECSTVERGTAC
jgi:hypothetical protein